MTDVENKEDVENPKTNLNPSLRHASSVSELESFQINGVLEWSDLAFTLNRADVMANLLRIKSLEIIGKDIESMSSHRKQSLMAKDTQSGLLDIQQSGGELKSRQFGWDHKCSQLCLFSVRYIQKRDRGIKDWYMDCMLLIGGAAVMGVIVGPTTKDTMVDTGPLLLNHLMIVMVSV